MEVLEAIGWSVVNGVAKIVAIADVVNGSFWEISKTKHCIWPAKAQVGGRQRVVGWFCCASDFRSGVPAQDQPVPFLDEQPSDLDPSLREVHPSSRV
ncbi:MAG TPA: hypothetical protein VFO90_05730 [Terrimicrobiaceae bacterium]|nr:hypothetical protein [Terrimicrobiaceae bacterium]